MKKVPILEQSRAEQSRADTLLFCAALTKNANSDVLPDAENCVRRGVFFYLLGVGAVKCRDVQARNCEI